MKIKTAIRNNKTTRRMLAAYWVYKMLSGGNPSKTTLQVLALEKERISRELQKQEEEQKPVPRRSPLAAGALCRSMIGKILKAQKVY